MKIFLALVLLVCVSCTHSIHIAHQGDFSPSYKAVKDGDFLRVEKKQHTILGFVTETNYVDQAYRELMQKCPGQLQGLNTQFSTSHGFFSWTNIVRIQGLCVKN